MTPRRSAKVGGLVLAALLCAARPVAAQTADTLSAKEIVRRADELLRGRTQQGKYRMTIIRPDWQRTTEFAFWSEGTEKSFIRVLDPRRTGASPSSRSGGRCGNTSPGSIASSRSRPR
jgi:hypothetical protein